MEDRTDLRPDDEGDAKIAGLIRDLYAPPAAGAYWDGLEGRIMANIARYRSSLIHDHHGPGSLYDDTHAQSADAPEDCAQTLEAALVTGDGDLRKAALAAGVEVHGILWMLDEMVAGAKTPPRHAAEMLERILKTRARLPAAECEVRLARWRSGRAK